jgi:hypothetical protein
MLASITFLSLPFSYWIDKPQFLTEEKLAIVLNIPSSWGSQLGGHPACIISSELGGFGGQTVGFGLQRCIPGYEVVHLGL